MNYFLKPFANDEFKHFLLDESVKSLKQPAEYGIDYYMKFNFSANTTLIYTKYLYNNSSCVADKLQLACIYFNEEKLLLEANHQYYFSLNEISSFEKNCKAELESKILDKINEMISQFTPEIAKKLGGMPSEDFVKYQCFENVENDYLQNIMPEDIHTTIDKFEYPLLMETFIDYIQNNDLSDSLAKMIFEKNKKKYAIYYLHDQLEKDALRKLYSTIDPGSDLYLRKKIKFAIPRDAKTVTLVLLKNGLSFEGKYDTSYLNYRNAFYSIYSLDASSRRKFQQLFGNSADILPRDIVKILYRGKEVYSLNT